MKILGKEGLHDLDFNVPKGKVTARQAAMLNEVEKEIPSASDVDKAGDIELQEIAKGMEDSIFKIKDVQTDTDLFEHPLHDLLGLDKQLRSIRGSLKVEVAKKVHLEECIAKERRKLEEFRDYPGVYDDAMKEDITKRIDDLNEDLKVRQESIDLLKGRLKSQITSFKETIAKVLDKDTCLAEKIRTLFGEQGSGGAATSGGGEPHPKDEKGLKEWIRNKLKALASLLCRLGIKATEALPYNAMNPTSL